MPDEEYRFGPEIRATDSAGSCSSGEGEIVSPTLRDAKDGAPGGLWWLP
jgi:hypothetical protein